MLIITPREGGGAYLCWFYVEGIWQVDREIE